MLNKYRQVVPESAGNVDARSSCMLSYLSVKFELVFFSLQLMSQKEKKKQYGKGFEDILVKNDPSLPLFVTSV